MSWEILGLIIVLIIGIMLFVFRKNPFVEKYWKYAIILVPATVVLILILVNKRKGDQGRQHGQADALTGAISKIRDDLTETNHIAAIKTAAAKTEQAQVVKKLEDIKQIEDQKERLKQLADMLG